MTLAFVAAYSAGRRTSFDRGAKHGGISGGLARRDAPGRRADVAAVETEAYAADQALYVRFGHVCVCTTRATVSTVRALGDAPNEHRSIEARRLWVRLDDLSNGHVCSSFTLWVCCNAPSARLAPPAPRARRMACLTRWPRRHTVAAPEPLRCYGNRQTSPCRGVLYRRVAGAGAH
jgi:hypothetical protein